MRRRLVLVIAVAALAGCKGDDTPDVIWTNDGGVAERVVVEVGVFTDGHRDTAITERQPTPCEAMTCAGCCRNGDCKPGDSHNNCGTGSAACLACTVDTLCRAGVCAAIVLDAGPADGESTDVPSELAHPDASMCCLSPNNCVDCSYCPPNTTCSPDTGCSCMP